MFRLVIIWARAVLLCLLACVCECTAAVVQPSHCVVAELVEDRSTTSGGFLPVQNLITGCGSPAQSKKNVLRDTTTRLHTATQSAQCACRCAALRHNAMGLAKQPQDMKTWQGILGWWFLCV